MENMYWPYGSTVIKTFSIEKTRCNSILQNILQTSQNWFAKLCSGNFQVEDTPRSGRALEAEEGKIKALIDANRRITTREIAERLIYRSPLFMITWNALA